MCDTIKRRQGREAREKFMALLPKLRGAHYMNLLVRINGEDRQYEVDWLPHLFDEEPGAE